MKRLAVVLAAVLGVLGTTPAAMADLSIEDKIAKHRAEIQQKIAEHRAQMRSARTDRTDRASRPSAPAPETTVRQQKAAPAPTGPTSPASGGERIIEIIISSQRLRAWDGQQLVMDTHVSTGKSGYATPTGRYSVLSKERRHWSTQYGVWMPYAMRVVRGIFIHEVPITAEGRRYGSDQLGSPASAGCIRVGVGPAERLYNWASVGTPVLIR